jgi:hypothetical protein
VGTDQPVQGPEQLRRGHALRRLEPRGPLTGHSIGLADLYASSDEELSMYGYPFHGDVKRRTLGRGDMIGMRTKYP